MADVRVEPRQEAVDVVISGDLTIDTLNDLAGRFQSALEFNRHVVVHVDHVASFDVSGIQLCLALRRDAAAQDIDVEFTGEDVVARFRRMLSFAGLPEL